MDKLRGAGEDQAAATGNLLQATKDEANAAEEQASAMDKLREAGEAQARSMDGLKGAGELQAAATEHLADNSANQLALIKSGTDATQAQAASTDRLAKAGEDQAAAVLKSLDTAQAANKIAADASAANNRPWVNIQAPVGPHELVAGSDYKVDLNIGNPGRSPATNVQFADKIEFLPVTVAIGDLDPCLFCAKITLFPEVGFDGTGQVFHLTIAKENITPAHLTAYQNLTEVILIRARADYTDSAGNAHHTFLCVYYVPQAKGLGGYTSCVNGNRAD
jgi:hypothetical protein